MIDKIIYKNFSLMKKNDEDLKNLINSKNPSHNLNISDDKYENKKVVGSAWLKQKDFGIFYSGKFNNSYTRKDGTNIDEYVIISKSYLEELLKQDLGDGIPEEIKNEEVNPNDVPF